MLQVEAVARDYAGKVGSGQIVAGKFLQLLCKRFLDELLLSEQARLFFNGSPENGLLRFDAEVAQRAVNFFGALKHSKGEWGGKSFILSDWQIFILANVFGWYRADGTRRFREVHIEIGRKNGKSTFLAGLGLYMLVADGEPGAEIYCVATKKDQAKIVFDEATRMRSASPLLASKIKVFRNNLNVPSTNSKFEPLSSEDDTLDGLNTHGGLVDELHAHPSRKLYDQIFESIKSRRNPLIWTITTAGYDTQGICWKQRTLGTAILEGVQVNDSFFPFIACLDEKDDPFDEKNWPKANPNMGISVKLDGLREGAVKAKSDPSSMNSFLRKHMNVWTAQDVRWMPMEKWVPCCAAGPHSDAVVLRKEALGELNPDSERSLKGRVCFGGLDLSSKEDVTAFVLLFPPSKDDKLYRVMPWFWLPKEAVEKRVREARVEYDVWERNGFLLTTPGARINTDFIRKTINEIRDSFSIQDIGFDDWGSSQLVPQLTSDGFKLEVFRQGFKSYSEPMKMFSALVGSREMEHYGNPMLTWMAYNVQAETDAAGGIKPDKQNSREKIDGISAAIMALGRAMANPDAIAFSLWDGKLRFLEDSGPVTQQAEVQGSPLPPAAKPNLTLFRKLLYDLPHKANIVVRDKDGKEHMLPRKTAALHIASGLVDFVRGVE